jgi:tetratricopeptide (TPR) repeat protein
MQRLVIVTFVLVLLAGCMPNTYYSISDPYALGLRLYDRGEYDAAAKYWDPLVEKGDCDAEYHVGVMYFLGKGKPHDNQRAITLWRKAADGNHPKAQAAMGDLYYQNDSAIFHHCVKCGIQKDLVQAYTWYKLAAKSARYDGEKGYISRVQKLITEGMSKEQIEAGDKAVAQWQPTPQDCKPRNWW